MVSFPMRQKIWTLDRGLENYRYKKQYHQMLLVQLKQNMFIALQVRDQVDQQTHCSNIVAMRARHYRV